MKVMISREYNSQDLNTVLSSHCDAMNVVGVGGMQTVAEVKMQM